MRSSFILLAVWVFAAPFVRAVFPIYNGCPIGQVYSDSNGRCTYCGVGKVKTPDEDGADSATCESARLVCGTAEVALYGSCKPCPSTQVAVDDVRCANCPSGFVKTPSGSVSDATCKRSSTPRCIPRTEICNGKDDNCDGLVDNMPPIKCGKGICQRTVAACINGRPQTCEPGSSRTEVCNNLDDNCDGKVDEGTISCGVGACAVTVNKCSLGKTQRCSPRMPTPEVCYDGIDNDCDGKVDEGSEEVCDGYDNNCDGEVDEGFDDILCAPCNIKVAGCSNGELGTCEGVCGIPCCQDCPSFRDVQGCRSSCQQCVETEDCLDWADDVAEKVGEAACADAVQQCGVFSASGGNALVGGRLGSRVQCYYAAFDICTSGGQYYMENNDGSGMCEYYWSGGGMCSAQKFQSLALARLDELCHDVSLGIAIAVDSP